MKIQVLLMKPYQGVSKILSSVIALNNCYYYGL